MGAQTFNTALLDVLERRATGDVVTRAFHTLRDAGFDNVSLDLVYGIPGQSAADLQRDLELALALEPEHLSCYELEAKPATRFTHTFGNELARQSEAMEGYFAQVVETLTAAGYRWYETANFCRTPEAGRAGAPRDLRSRHNLAYWLGRDYLGLGIGAVSTHGDRRWRNAPRLAPYLAALGRVEGPPREWEELPAETRRLERVMLGLRLDEPLPLAGLEQALDPAGLARAERLGLAERDGDALRLTTRGRFVGDGVTAELVA